MYSQRIDFGQFVGFAIAHFHTSPSDAWDMSFYEFWAAHDALNPPEKEFFVAPFDEEELAVFDEIRKRKGWYEETLTENK